MFKIFSLTKGKYPVTLKKTEKNYRNIQKATKNMVKTGISGNFEGAE